jgi:uncharacterized DUF497 family protein
MRILADVVGFEWDDGNRSKILKKHGLKPDECEEIFRDANRQFFPDIGHSAKEERYVVVGQTQNGKILFIAFTIRNNNFRIISARPINRKEIRLYE